MGRWRRPPYGSGMEELAIELDDIARRTGFSGVVRIDDRSGPRVTQAYGLADRRHGIPATVDTRFAIASGVKSLTALTVMALVERGELTLDTPARAVLGDDLPLVDDAVTVEQLLAHRSGIGDYLDEDSGLDVDDYLLPVPVHQLATTEQYLAVLDGHPQKFPPGRQFSYCNSGFVVLALMAERRGGAPFAELVRELVCAPAGMARTEFLRSDELPGDAAIGYLAADRPRTNVLHLPVVGSGDGGIYTTVADVHSLWESLDAGRIVPPATGGLHAGGPQRRALGIQTVWARVLAGCDRPGGDDGGNGRRGVVPLPARCCRGIHLDGGVQHDRRCVAHGPSPRRGSGVMP